MASRSWMIDWLNQETATHHAHADRAVDALFRPSVVAEDYRAFLVSTYGFEAPLEVAMSQTRTLDTLLDLRCRTRVGLLAADLMSLGMRPQAVAELPMCLSVPQFKSAAEALGWMFVAERAALSHAVARRHLLTCLPVEIASASTYLEPGGQLGARWLQFGAALDHVANHTMVVERIIRAANDAFRCLAQWTSTVPNARITGPRRAVG